MKHELQIGDRVKITSHYPFDTAGKYGKLIKLTHGEFHRGTHYDYWLVNVFLDDGKSKEAEFCEDVLEFYGAIE